jgi:hypothetical protein
MKMLTIEAAGSFYNPIPARSVEDHSSREYGTRLGPIKGSDKDLGLFYLKSLEDHIHV